MAMDNMQVCLYECDQCRMTIGEQSKVFRAYDHTFCSEACRDCSPASLDHLYLSAGRWSSKTVSSFGLESKAVKGLGLRHNTSSRGLLRSGSSSTSVSSLERVPAVYDFERCEEPTLAVTSIADSTKTSNK